MKIRIVRDVPVSDRHGIKIGNEYICTEKRVGKGRDSRQYWITTVDGEDVRLMPAEFEYIQE